MTEYSIGIDPIAGGHTAPLSDVVGAYTDVPSIVPTLTKDELAAVLRGEVTPEIAEKAKKHAMDRAWEGKGPFASPSEQILNYPKD